MLALLLGALSLFAAASAEAQTLAAPTNLGVAAGNAQLVLTWTAPTGTVTGYDVHYTSAASGTVSNTAAVQTGAASVGWVDASHSGTTASQTISSLTNNTSYRVRVRAKNSNGNVNGEWVFGTGTPAAPTAGTPGAPTGLMVAPGSGQLGLTWTAPTGTLTGYDVHYTSSTTVSNTAVASGFDASTAWVAVTRTETDPPTASETLLGLLNGRPYRLRVRAKNATGAGAWAFGTGTPVLALAWNAATATDAEENSFSQRIQVDTDIAISGTLTYTAGATNGASLSADLQTGYGTTFSAAAGSTYLFMPRSEFEDDTVNEEHETFTITINAGTGYIVGMPATVTVTIEDNDPPAAPSGLSLTAGSGKLSASWTKPAGPVTGYELRHKQTTAMDRTATTAGDPSTGWVTSTASITTTSAEITGLTNGTAYHVQVRATDGQTESGNGYGDWSASQSGTPAVPAIAAPTGLTVQSRDTALILGWAPVTGATGYDVHYTSAVASSVSNSATASGNDPSAAWVDASHTGTTTSQTISSLTNNTLYRVRVRATNNDGSSAWVFGTGTPAVWTTVTVTAGDSKLDLSWTAPASGTVSGYDVDYTTSTTVAADATTGSNVATGWVSSLDAVTQATTQTTHSITSLSNGTAYRVRVRAFFSDFTYTGYVTGTGTPQPPPPAAPTNLGVSPGDGSLSLSWTAPSGTVTGYDVHYTSAASGTVANDAAVQTVSAAAGWVVVNRTGTTASQTISSLSNGTLYRVRVRAKNGGGNSAWVFGMGTPAQVMPPGVPRNVRIVPGNNRVTMTWEAPSSWGTYAANAFEYGPSHNTGASLAVSTSSTSQTRHCAGSGNTAYACNGATETWRVRARSQQTGSNPAVYLRSNWVSVTVTVGVPAVPTGLSATPGNQKLDLTWTAPAQNGGPITGYDLHYTSAAASTVANDVAASGNDPSTAWVNASHSGTTASQTILSLSNGTTYRWRVRAKNTHGAGGWAFGTGRTPLRSEPVGVPEPGRRGLKRDCDGDALGAGAGGYDTGDGLNVRLEHCGTGRRRDAGRHHGRRGRHYGHGYDHDEP